MKRFFPMVAGIAILLNASIAGAAAYSVNGHVVTVEGSYAPTRIPITMDTAAGSCSAGAVMIFYPMGISADERISATNVVLSTLITAKATGALVSIIGDDVGCRVNYAILR